jgi:hypothetical protein
MGVCHVCHHIHDDSGPDLRRRPTAASLTFYHRGFVETGIVVHTDRLGYEPSRRRGYQHGLTSVRDPEESELMPREAPKRGSKPGRSVYGRQTTQKRRPPRGGAGGKVGRGTWEAWRIRPVTHQSFPQNAIELLVVDMVLHGKSVWVGEPQVERSLSEVLLGYPFGWCSLVSKASSQPPVSVYICTATRLPEPIDLWRRWYSSCSRTSGICRAARRVDSPDQCNAMSQSAPSGF